MDIEQGPIRAVLREKAPDRAPLIKSLAELPGLAPPPEAHLRDDRPAAAWWTR